MGAKAQVGVAQHTQHDTHDMTTVQKAVSGPLNNSPLPAAVRRAGGACQSTCAILSTPCSTRRSCRCPASDLATATRAPAPGPGRICHTWQGCDAQPAQLGTAAGDRRRALAALSNLGKCCITAAELGPAMSNLARAHSEAAAAAGRAARRGHRACQVATEVVLDGAAQVPLESSKPGRCSRPLPPKRLCPLAWRVWEPRRTNLVLASASWDALGAWSRPAAPTSEQDIPEPSPAGAERFKFPAHEGDPQCVNC